MNLFRLLQHPAGLLDLTADAVENQLSQGPVIIDVRTAREYAQGHIPGAISIPLGHEQDIAQKWSRDTHVILICKTGHRSQAAAATLLKLGFQHVSHLKGGMDAWRQSRKPTTS